MENMPPLGPVSPAMAVFWDALRDARSLAERHHKPAIELRDTLVEKHGEPRPGKSADAAWGHDPDCARLIALNTMSDRFGTFETERMADALDLPAASIADLAYKLAVVARVWRQTGGIEEKGDYHEKIAAAFFEDAHRLLLPMMPAAD